MKTNVIIYFILFKLKLDIISKCVKLNTVINPKRENTMPDDTQDLNFNEVKPNADTIIPIVDFDEENSQQFRYFIENNE